MKIGTIGSGVIVRRMLDAINLIEGVEAVAVYSRTYEKGSSLAKDYNINKIYTNLDEMFNDESINTIYVASPNSLHYIQSKEALLSGKNVICEKPFTSTLFECNDLIKTAKANNLFIWEAITTKYLPNYQVIKDNLNLIGDVRLVNLNFSQYSSKYQDYKDDKLPNVFNPKFSGGALMDINIYNIHFMLGLFGVPKSYEYIANVGKTNVDTSGILVLDYGNFKAIAMGAKDCSAEYNAYIQGDAGSIKISKSSVGVCDTVEYLPTKGDMIGKNNNDNGVKNLGIKQKQHMTYEVKAFYDMFKNNDLNKCYETLDYTLEVMNVLYNARIKANIKFEADKNEKFDN